MAARVTGSGALKLFACCGLVPVKSMRGRCASSRSTVIVDCDSGALIGLDAEMPVAQFGNEPAHAFFGVVLHMPM